jgi:hypothetical protein
LVWPELIRDNIISSATRRFSHFWTSADNDNLGIAVSMVALVLASVVSLFVPAAGQYMALLSAMLCAVHFRSFLLAPIVVFAHAGSVVFASRALLAESSDFVVYYDLFENICRGGAPLEDALFSFGTEIGLPLVYKALSVTGACGLSITGLAYFQTLIVSVPILWLLCSRTSNGWTPEQSALVVGGTMALFSFVYVTQLSRQAISSGLLLWILVDRRSNPKAIGALVLATIFHLTAPLIFSIAWLVRSAPRVATVILAGVCLLIYVLGGDLLQWILEHFDSFEGISKLMIYATDADPEGAVGSDLRAVAYLLAAGMASLPLTRKSTMDLTLDARMLLGFGALAGVMLLLPLAATRFTLAFSALAIGYFLFRALVLQYPRTGVFVLISALIFKSGLLNIMGPDDQTMWQSYPAWSLYPLYYLMAF